jgi:hypothetical protein
MVMIIKKIIMVYNEKEKRLIFVNPIAMVDNSNYIGGE